MPLTSVKNNLCPYKEHFQIIQNLTKLIQKGSSEFKIELKSSYMSLQTLRILLWGIFINKFSKSNTLIDII